MIKIMKIQQNYFICTWTSFNKYLILQKSMLYHVLFEVLVKKSIFSIIKFEIFYPKYNYHSIFL